jgi:hypothetical protein
MISIIRKDDLLYVDTPYNAEFVVDMKRHIPRELRKWNSDAKVWMISVRAESTLLSILREIFGYSPGEVPTRVEIVANNVRCDDTKLYVAGKLLCSCSSRDSGAWVGPGVLLKTGNIDSGGSRNHPCVLVSDGAVFELDLFEDAISMIGSEWGVFRIQENADVSVLKEERAILAEKLRILDEKIHAASVVVSTSVFEDIGVHDVLKD